MTLKINKYNLVFGGLLLCLVFQNPLEEHIIIFKYFDELLGVIGISFIAIYLLFERNGRIPINYSQCIVMLCVFLLGGIISNVLYMFQPFRYVIIDVITNIKFFGAMCWGILIGYKVPIKYIQKTSVFIARFCTLVLFFLCILDKLFNIFKSSDIRYGMKSLQLFYFHPTYLAAALVFLNVILTVFPIKNNIVYALMNVVMMILTCRSKAIAAAGVYLLLWYYCMYRGKKIKIAYLALIFGVMVLLAWNHIRFYYFDLAGKSARSILTLTSFQIAWDYFPLGTGFATFASSEAAIHYSPVYELYKLSGEINPNSHFLNDTFWPIIIGQTGVVGTISYLYILGMIAKRCFFMWHSDKGFYTGGLFALIYLMISSTGEPTFNNSISIPLALILGIIFMAVAITDNKKTFY